MLYFLQFFLETTKGALLKSKALAYPNWAWLAKIKREEAVDKLDKGLKRYYWLTIQHI